jgi:hypothetical protein
MSTAYGKLYHYAYVCGTLYKLYAFGVERVDTWLPNTVHILNKKDKCSLKSTFNGIEEKTAVSFVFFLNYPFRWPDLFNGRIFLPPPEQKIL